MDDKISILNGNCPSILKVACPPPGIGAKISESSFAEKCSDGAEK
jgi:hypothetical protein